MQIYNIILNHKVFSTSMAYSFISIHLLTSVYRLDIKVLGENRTGPENRISNDTVMSILYVDIIKVTSFQVLIYITSL